MKCLHTPRTETLLSSAAPAALGPAIDGLSYTDLVAVSVCLS